jgi:hypothetical protein
MTNLRYCTIVIFILFIHVSCCSFWSRGHFNFLILYTVGRTHWKGDRHCRKAATYTGQHKSRRNADIHASSGIRIHDPNVWAREDSYIINTPLWLPSLQFLSSLILTYLRSWALLEKPPILQLLKTFPEFYGIRMFITVFTRAIHWSLSWTTLIQSLTTLHYLSKIYFNVVHPPTSWSS